MLQRRYQVNLKTYDLSVSHREYFKEKRYERRNREMLVREALLFTVQVWQNLWKRRNTVAQEISRNCCFWTHAGRRDRVELGTEYSNWFRGWHNQRCARCSGARRRHNPDKDRHRCFAIYSNQR